MIQSTRLEPDRPEGINVSSIEIDLSGRVAIVTGGTRGIGWEISRTLGEAGADVVPVSRTADDVDVAVSSLADEGVRAIGHPTDVTDVEAVESLIDSVIDEFGHLDLLVNNAGINPVEAMGTPETVDLAAFERPISVNLIGAFNCSHVAGEHLLERDGSVINVASTAGLVGVKRQHAYVASKHGLVGLTKSMAMDWAPSVRVNAIAPGYIETDLTEPVMEMDELYQRILDQTPAGRFGSPAEVANVAVFLASDLASFITGECIVVDGGLTV